MLFFPSGTFFIAVGKHLVRNRVLRNITKGNLPDLCAFAGASTGWTFSPFPDAGIC